MIAGNERGRSALAIIEPPDPSDAEATLPTPASVSLTAQPVKLLTLGCKVNQYETQYVRELLLANGYREARPGEAAALAVVNTCTVTSEGDRKSRQLVRRLARENPGVKIVVMGCYATADPTTVGRLPNVARVVTDKRDLAGALQPFGIKRSIAGIRQFEGRSRAFVKVQDGCILNCTFCIIPTVRPGLQSRPPEEIRDEVRGLVEAGYCEVVLAGIHLGHYGVDLSQGRPRAQWRRLWHLLRMLSELPGDFRIRLSSLEATEVTDDFLRVLGDYSERICPHLHLSMQSGSNRILRAMKRRYRIERFLDRCDRLRDRLEEPAFTTDVIVGFPGESDRDFAATLDACREAAFAKIHVFPFSARRGTQAASMTDQIPRSIIDQRRDALGRQGHEQTQNHFHSLLGRRLQMLVEGPDPKQEGMVRGTACRYAPLRLRTLASLTGRLVEVIGARVDGDALVVEPYFDETTDLQRSGSSTDE